MEKEFPSNRYCPDINNQFKDQTKDEYFKYANKDKGPTL